MRARFKKNGIGAVRLVCWHLVRSISLSACEQFRAPLRPIYLQTLAMMKGELNSFEPTQTPIPPSSAPEKLNFASRQPSPAWEELLQRARSGSPAAVGQLLDQCRAYLTVVVQHGLGQHLRAKVAPSDIVQESMLDAYRGFEQFEGTTEKELLGWLRRTLLNNLTDATRHYRGTARRDFNREFATHKDLQGEDPLAVVEAKSALPLEKVIRSEEQQRLLEAIRRLPPRQRRVVMLRNLEFKPFHEIGMQLQISADAARKLWERAIQRLTEDLKSDDRSSPSR